MKDQVVALEKPYIDLYQFAIIYVGLGEKDEAFRLLEKGYEQCASSMSYLSVDPFWYGMRSDPRYTDLLRRVGLPTAGVTSPCAATGG